MQTPGHIILNLGILGHRHRPKWTSPIMLGAFVPDAAMFWFYIWTRIIQGRPDSEIWGTLYFLPHWQNIFDLFNSIPLALIGLSLALYYKRSAIAAFCASTILHCLQDLPLHHDDGHRHFWPFSEFRFESPVSYWDPQHYGVWGAGLETVLVLVASYFIFRRTRSQWGKSILILMNILYLLLYFGYLWASGNIPNP
ncbi:hypothetical protein [Calothrix rhizosoleniae]|uniref:hypothetical protein n=1 Tax=Calothrix rhizosoleniae TaxID=888997 RepID=UPI000B4A39BC|nr:hypothetical protein [Calothrix rhizosoleniae]